jgi:short subunit dehydrogenase-like uncharacterized protein
MFFFENVFISCKKMDKLDVIIFGASGLTGKYMIIEAIRILDGLKWGIAGRNYVSLI